MKRRDFIYVVIIIIGLVSFFIYNSLFNKSYQMIFDTNESLLNRIDEVEDKNLELKKWLRNLEKENKILEDQLDDCPYQLGRVCNASE